MHIKRRVPSKQYAVYLPVFFLLMLILAGCVSSKGKVNRAADYPVRPITMIVPTSAGGSLDLMARAMEKAAVKHLGQPLVVQNIPGGGATLGWNELAGAKPDGYTLGTTTSGLILQPLIAPTRYHYPTALEPLAQAVTLPIFATLRSDQPWNSIDDLVKYAKQHPGEIKFGHPGLGSSRHVVGEMLAKEAGINIAQVSFNGEAEALAALLGGHIQLVFLNTSILKEYVKSGKVKVLAVAAEQRLDDPIFLHVPTFKEQGLDVVFNLWQGVGAPKGLPKHIKNQLTEGLEKIINDPEFRRNMEALGMTVEYLGPQQSCEKWIADDERLMKVMKDMGIAERIIMQKK